MDTPEDRPDEAVEHATADDVALERAEWDEGLAEPVEPRGHLLLGVLAAIAVAAVGVVVWAILYATVPRDFFGISVLIGLVSGYALRELSGRSTIPVRVIAVVVTALACVAGTVVGTAAYAASDLNTAFWPMLRDMSEDWWRLLRNREWLHYVIYGAALVIAFLSAGPKKEAPAKKRTEDEADDDADVTESADPATLPDEG